MNADVPETRRFGRRVREALATVLILITQANSLPIASSRPSRDSESYHS